MDMECFFDDVPVDLKSRTGLSGSYSHDYTVQILPVSNNQALLAGTFTGIAIGKAVSWETGLGTLCSARGAGRIVFREPDLTSSPETRAHLYYSPPTNLGEITVVKDGPSSTVLRQIRVPQTVVDLVDDVSNGYWMKFYALSQATWSGSIYTFSGSPWRTIRVESPGTDQLKITETEGSVSRVSLLALTSGSVGSGAYVWQLQEGDGSSVLRTTVHTSSVPTAGQRDDVVQLRTGGVSGTVVAKTKYHYVTQAWGDEELIQMIADPDTTALTTTYDYWATSTDYGNYRKVKSVTDATGNWTAYEYYDDWNRRGQLKNEYHPYVNSPGTVSLNTSLGRVISLDYQQDWTTRYRNQLSRYEAINGVTTSKTLGAQALNQYMNGQLYTVKLTDWYRDSTNRHTTYLDTIDWGNGFTNPDWYGTVLREQGIGAVQTNGQRQHGTYNPTTKQFGPGWGDYVIDVQIHGTAFTWGGTFFNSWRSLSIEGIYLVPYQSTVVESVRDPAGKIIRTTTQVYTGGTSFSLMTADEFTYDSAGRLLTQTRDNNTLVTNTYTNGRLFSSVDAAGTETQFSYDALGRVDNSIKKGVAASGSYAAQGDITTAFTYDGADHVTQTVSSGSSLSLTNSTAYDLAGRTTSNTAPGGYTTGYAYSSGGKIVTTTLPSTATHVAEVFLDGKSKQVTGTSIIAEYHTPGVDGSGNQTLVVNVGTSTSTNQTTTTFDWIGRKISFVQPTWSGGTATNTWLYNISGQLWKSTNPGTAPTLYQYDYFGNVSRQGLDITGNDSLDLASNDRITDHNWYYFLYGTAWAKRDTTSVYPQSGNGTPKQIEQIDNILVNPAGRLSGVIRYDVFGNGTTSVVDVTPGAKTLVTTTYAPTFAAYTEQIAYNGLAVSARDLAGNITTIGYDALGRAITSTDPRTGTTTTAYVSGTSQVYTVTDPTSIVQATYTYDSAGRISSVKDGLNKYAYTNYTNRNEIYRQWGDTAVPVEYGYDNWGHQTAMKTYRGGSGWSGSTWPASPGTADTTTWAFHEPTGLLSSKTDAAGKTVSYTYTPARQIDTRQWARILTGTTHLTTTYGYSSTTGELTSVDYNDSTTDLNYTYNRLGSIATATDVTGTRTLNYNLAGTLEMQSEDLSSFFSSKRITYPYSTSGIIGRLTGLQLGTSGSPTADQSITYGYDTYWRLNSFVGGSQTFNYGYATNSNLIATVTNSGASYTDTRTYDATHDWIDNRKTQIGSTTKAEFAYAQDNLGRTTNVVRTGEVFTRYGNGTEGLKSYYGYDDRSQVTSEVTKVGATATVLTGRDDAFAYDTMGNRASTAGTTHNGSAAGYTTNALNQYTQRVVPGIFDIAGAFGTGTTVTVNGSSSGVVRHGEYFFKGLSQSNNPNPVYSTPTVSDGTTTYNLPAFTVGTPEAMAYDDDGNLTSDGRWDYSYDAENRLNSVQTHTALSPSPLPNADARRLEFKNDYLGRRVEKLIRSGWNGSTFTTVASDEKYVYNSWNLMARLNAAASNAILASYYWGTDLSGSLQGAGGVGGLLLIQDSGNSYLPAYDGNGNIYGLIKASDGSLAAAYEYDAFGQTIRESGTYAASNTFRFSTKFTDLETALVYYGLRYYSPTLGRFINKDPIEEKGGLNLYGFCLNNGVNKWDYLGQDPLQVVMQQTDFIKSGSWTSGEGSWHTITVYNDGSWSSAWNAGPPADDQWVTTDDLLKGGNFVYDNRVWGSNANSDGSRVNWTVGVNGSNPSAYGVISGGGGATLDRTAMQAQFNKDAQSSHVLAGPGGAVDTVDDYGVLQLAPYVINASDQYQPEDIAKVIYGETRGLRGNANDLSRMRQALAHVLLNQNTRLSMNRTYNRPGQFLPGNVTIDDTNRNAFNDVLIEVEAAIEDGDDPSSGADQFRTEQRDRGAEPRYASSPNGRLSNGQPRYPLMLNPGPFDDYSQKGKPKKTWVPMFKDKGFKP